MRGILLGLLWFLLLGCHSCNLMGTHVVKIPIVTLTMKNRCNKSSFISARCPKMPMQEPVKG